MRRAVPGPGSLCGLALAGALAAALWAACDPAEESGGPVAPGACTDADFSHFFDRTIAPLASSERQQSCSQCHLPGLDLSIFMVGDACASMGCMVQTDLVRFDDAGTSPVLDFVRRGINGEGQTPARASSELDALQSWIEYASRCYESVCETDNDTDRCVVLEPARPDPCEVDCNDATQWREEEWGCDEAGVGVMFVDVVEPWLGRCGVCHRPPPVIDVGDPPQWIDPETGEVAALRTLANLNELGAFDFDDPTQSLLLLKPLSESLGGVEHGGGEKISHISDGTYEDLLRFIEEYAECRE